MVWSTRFSRTAYDTIDIAQPAPSALGGMKQPELKRHSQSGGVSAGYPTHPNPPNTSQQLLQHLRHSLWSGLLISPLTNTCGLRAASSLFL